MDKIKELFRLSGVNCILLKSYENVMDKNFYYFTGLDTSRNFSGAIILRKGSKPVVFANALEYKAMSGGNYKTVRIESYKQMKSAMSKLLPRVVGINGSTTTLSYMKGLRKMARGRKFVDVSRHLAMARETKTKYEIGKIKRACDITIEIMDEIPHIARPGMEENDVKRKVEEILRVHDVAFSFPPIIASGPNSSVPHHATGSRKIRSSEVLLVDIGVVFGNYCSDVTRTFFVGRAPEDVRNAYNNVERAQAESIRMIREGMKSRKLFAVANSIIKKEFGSGMIHSLGHGIGMDVHDFPEGISDRSKYALKSGMTLAIEPAWYGKKYGIRIEDDIIAGKRGCEMLTESPKEITEI